MKRNWTFRDRPSITGGNFIHFATNYRVNDFDMYELNEAVNETTSQLVHQRVEVVPLRRAAIANGW